MPTYVVAGDRLLDLDRLAMAKVPQQRGSGVSRFTVAGEGFYEDDHGLALAIWKAAVAHHHPVVLERVDVNPPPATMRLVPVVGKANATGRRARKPKA